MPYILKSCPENHNCYRSGANNADDVATTTLASDLPTLHPEDQILSPEDLILSLWHVHVILFACATLRWSYLVILAFDQQSTLCNSTMYMIVGVFLQRSRPSLAPLFTFSDTSVHCSPFLHIILIKSILMETLFNKAWRVMTDTQTLSIQ